MLEDNPQESVDPERVEDPPEQVVAEPAEEPPKPKRGRPKGSKNKQNQLFRDYLPKSGYRHPGLNLADMANARIADLAKELGCKPVDAYVLIMRANEALMPYFESKRPTDVHVEAKQMGLLVIESGASFDQNHSEDGIYSLTGVVSESDDKSST